jgi:RNA polymerase sigma-70 factor (ECF subfamily)
MTAEMDSPSAGAAQAAEERALIERILAGQKELFYELVRPHERGVFLAALAILRNEADAEEVAQEAILKALRNLKQFRGEAKFSTWLVRIAINEARMRIRGERKHLYQSLDAGTGDEEEGEYTPIQMADWREIPSEALERKEIQEEITRALGELPDNYRAVLVLRDVQQMSIAETAAALGVSDNVVKVRLFRARLRMRDLLAPRLSKTAFAGRRRKGGFPWF